jgi:leader peptidase (prepilin peptidase)/N-methyltransferase
MASLLEPGMQPVIMVLIFLVGICVGSFLNVMGLRFLADEPVIMPPSHCPKCQFQLRPIDNIPVLSYLMLGGQCHSCKEPISVQYPLIELATGVLFCLVVWMFGVSLQSLFLLFLISNLVVIFITDLRESLIFQVNSLSLIPAGLIYNGLNLGHVAGDRVIDLGVVVFHCPEAIVSALIGMGIALVFFEGMILISQICFGTDGFGHGDTHLMMGAGAFLGWPLTVLALMLGFVFQTIPAIPMLVWQWIQNKQYVSLISGATAMVCAGMPLVMNNLAVTPETRMMVTLACLVISVVALIVFLRQVRTAQTFTYLPLGPALVLGILVALFWGNPILTAYHNFMISSHP